MNWFEKVKAPKIKKTPDPSSEKNVRVPEGFWVKCVQCAEILQAKSLRDNLQVCTECGHHFRLGGWDRISFLCGDTFKELNSNLKSKDPLGFIDTKPYTERLEGAFKKTGLKDALISGVGTLSDENKSIEIALGVFEFSFLGGSMGVVVGEKIARLMEVALKKKLPVVLFCSSGGARMQEGILSLMQMAKVSSLVSELNANSIPFVTVLTDPTTGGVAASFAFQADFIFAEPGALIGFAGPRVIEQTMRQALPEGFQRAEFLLKHGFIDQILHRKEIPQHLLKLLLMLKQGSCLKKISSKK